MSRTDKPKRGRGRPPKPMPVPIDADPMTVARVVLGAKPKKDWRYQEEDCGQDEEPSED